jgi:transposase InsO family protein
MTSTQQRQTLLALIAQACHDGARLHKACALIGLSARTVQRWQHPLSAAGDRRIDTLRAKVQPPNKLSLVERQAAMLVLNSNEFKDLPPSQIVPRLADAGQYVASESTLYRLLRQAGQLTHRCPTRLPRKVPKPRALLATQPDQIYCWDITYLPAPVRGMHFYLYLFVDIFSRKIVGWQVYDRESADLAGQLLRDICERQGIPQGQLTVHSDNGSPMKGESMLATMQRLGVAHSRSRPSVSNDNPYSESLFRTLKYRPQLPLKPFADLLHARRWVTELVHWYNHEHWHSAIRFVTPEQRHAGMDHSMLKQRIDVYTAAREKNPARWTRSTRNWSPIHEVHLNPTTPHTKDLKPTLTAL